MKAKQMEGQWVAEMTKRRELHNQLQDMVGSLRVACRVRPIKGDDTAITIKESTSGGDPQVVINYMGPGDKPAEKQFDFTHVYGPKSTQEQVFKDSAELMTSVLDGYNVCIFAYALGRVSDVAPAQTRAQPHTAQRGTSGGGRTSQGTGRLSTAYSVFFSLKRDVARFGRSLAWILSTESALHTFTEH